MEYYIGQIFEGMYPSEAAKWCNENGAMMVELDPITKEVEEEYEETNENDEIETKTRVVEKEFRVFQIQEIPVVIPTKEEQSRRREIAYCSMVDPITSHISRLRDQEQTEEVIAEIERLIAERDEKVAEIKRRYPYPED